MNNEIQNKIDAYLRGEMSPEERDVFEQKVKTDATWAEELELTRLIQQALSKRQIKMEKMADWDREQNLEQNLDQNGLQHRDRVGEKSSVPAEKRRRQLWGYTSLVAACLLGFFLVLQNNEPEGYVYDAAFFQHETSYRGGGEEVAINRLIADGQYATALSAIDSLEKICREEMETAVMGESSEEEIYNRQVAEETLYQLTWQRIQIYLAQNKVEQAITVLRSFRLQKGEYQAKAEELWTVLENR